MTFKGLSLNQIKTTFLEGMRPTLIIFSVDGWNGLRKVIITFNSFINKPIYFKSLPVRKILKDQKIEILESEFLK